MCSVQNSYPQIMKTIFRSVIFSALGLFLFCIIQNIVSFKWGAYLQDNVYSGYVFSELTELNEELVDIQAFFLGTSHSRWSIDPMQIYDDYGFVTYNISTSGQPMEGSYFLLKNLLHDFHPKVVFLDVSGLFSDSRDDVWHHNILDNMGNNTEKLEYAIEYAKINDDESFGMKRFKAAMLPFYQYHSRWKELRDYDYALNCKFNYFLKGYYLSNFAFAAGADVQWMNDVAYQNHQNIGFTQILSSDEPAVAVIDEEPAYAPQVFERNYDYLRKINSLCKENEIHTIGPDQNTNC